MLRIPGSLISCRADIQFWSLQERSYSLLRLVVKEFWAFSGLLFCYTSPKQSVSRGSFFFSNLSTRAFYAVLRNIFSEDCQLSRKPAKLARTRAGCEKTGRLQRFKRVFLIQTQDYTTSLQVSAGNPFFQLGM